MNTIDIHILYCKLCILFNIEAYSIRRQQEGSSIEVVMLLILANAGNMFTPLTSPIVVMQYKYT